MAKPRTASSSSTTSTRPRPSTGVAASPAAPAHRRVEAGKASFRNIWIITISLLVTVIGISNAMLMSVTERFREIGTMKCLGALDSLVLWSVLVEAAFLGLLGAVIGVVVGFIIALALSLADYGLGGFGMINWLVLPLKVLAVFLVGMTLTTVGAAVPAWIASKMPPVEAMRGEK